MLTRVTPGSVVVSRRVCDAPVTVKVTEDAGIVLREVTREVVAGMVIVVSAPAMELVTTIVEAGTTDSETDVTVEPCRVDVTTRVVEEADNVLRTVTRDVDADNVVVMIVDPPGTELVTMIVDPERAVVETEVTVLAASVDTTVDIVEEAGKVMRLVKVVVEAGIMLVNAESEVVMTVVDAEMVVGDINVTVDAGRVEMIVWSDPGPVTVMIEAGMVDVSS